jgi:hypothetical protein
LTNGSTTAWLCFGFCCGRAFHFFGGGGLARWRITAIMAKASITRETWRSFLAIGLLFAAGLQQHWPCC